MVFDEIVRNVIILTKQEKVKEGLYTEGLITGIDFFLHIDGPITGGASHTVGIIIGILRYFAEGRGVPK